MHCIGDPAPLLAWDKMRVQYLLFGGQKHMDIIEERDIAQVVRDAVAQEQVIDLHTHLFPPSHGRLMLWGCDALLTYHYLVAEYFISALEPPSPDAFYR